MVFEMPRSDAGRYVLAIRDRQERAYAACALYFRLGRMDEEPDPRDYGLSPLGGEAIDRQLDKRMGLTLPPDVPDQPVECEGCDSADDEGQ